MESFHRDQGARFSDYQGISSPADFGSVDDEHRALRDTCGLVERSWVSRLEMTGEDRVRFLNGLVTCDVKALPPGGSTYGFVTQVKGRIVADVLVLAKDDRLWLELPSSRCADVAEHLGKYALFDQVEIRPLEGLSALALIGAKASETLERVELSGVTVRQAEASELGVPMAMLWVASKDAAALGRKLLEAGAKSAGHEAWERLRVESGYPLCGQDYGIDNFPQETGLEDAVSYTKGCYLGQEVVARIHYRGGVNKSLRGLVFAGEQEPLGNQVLFDGRERGKVTSAVFSPVHGPIGLSILHKHVEVGAEVELDGGGSASVVELPFER